MQRDKTVSPGCQLELIPHLALQSCFAGPSNALKSSGTGTTGMSQEQKGREEHYSPAGSLDLCMGVAGSLTTIPFISGFLCLHEKLYQLCCINSNTENWARNGNITRAPNPNLIPFLHISRSISRNKPIFSLKLNSRS